jgi:Phospholipase_D-nuclease N-terminal
MQAVILSILFILHLAWAGNRLLDLFTKSRRDNKVQWMLLILLVPLIGVMCYNLTMKRKKYQK